MSKSFLGPLSLENIEAQFCSDWLKDEIRSNLTELETLKQKLAVADAAMLQAITDLKAKEKGLWKIEHALLVALEKIK